MRWSQAGRRAGNVVGSKLPDGQLTRIKGRRGEGSGKYGVVIKYFLGELNSHEMERTKGLIGLPKRKGKTRKNL